MAVAGHRLLQQDHTFNLPESETCLDSQEKIFAKKKKKKVKCHILHNLRKMG